MEYWPRRWGIFSRGIIGTMLEGSEFRCALCRGKGILRSGKAQCPACGGRGLVKITPPSMVCAYCKGRGEVPARSGITCAVCGGRGVVSVRYPVELCPRCWGSGTAPNSKLSCLLCRGKGVVTIREQGEKGRAERPQIQPEAEPYPIVLCPMPLLVPGQETDGGTGSLWQPQRRKEARMVRAGVVGGLVRHLMAIERARILGRKASDLSRYALEKRTERWRDSRKRF